MIASLGLQNFKAFAELATLELAPLTLLCGANSSGKSSILHGLLLLKQSLENPSAEESITLNGNIMTLGRFSDVFSTQSRSGEDMVLSIVIRIPIRPGPMPRADMPGQRRSPVSHRFGTPWYSQVFQRVLPSRSVLLHQAEEEAHVELRLAITEDPFDEGGAAVKALDIRWWLGERSDSGSAPTLSLVLDPDMGQYCSSTYDVPEELRQLLSGRLYRSTAPCDKDAGTVAYILEGFLPAGRLAVYNRTLVTAQLELLRDLLRVVCERLGIQRATLETESSLRTLLWEVAFSSGFRKRLRSMSGERGRSRTDEDSASRGVLQGQIAELLSQRPDVSIEPPVDGFLQVLGSLPQDDIQKMRAITDAHATTIRQARSARQSLRVERANLGGSLAGLPFLDLDDLTSLVRSFFVRGLYHLGPLREEPQAFYGRSGSGDPTYVGQRGENLALVLRYYGKRCVAAIVPPDPSRSDRTWNPINEHQELMSLEAAVVKWLNYLQMAESLRVEESGKSGIAIRAKIGAGDPESDLTNVGVGVSQLLPLLVLGLMAPPGSVLLLEQPELHLHPFVQSRLADYFLSLVALGKQVIAETHSEHLIYRTRLLIAEGAAEVGRHVRIYFTARDPGVRGAYVQEVKIGPFGDIEEWPDGFFDETEKTLDQIMRAALDRTSPANGGEQ